MDDEYPVLNTTIGCIAMHGDKRAVLALVGDQLVVESLVVAWLTASAVKQTDGPFWLTGLRSAKRVLRKEVLKEGVTIRCGSHPYRALLMVKRITPEGMLVEHVRQCEGLPLVG